MNKKTLLRIYFGIQFLIGLFIAGDLYNKFVFSTSTLDLILFGIVLTLTLGCPAVLLVSWRHPEILTELSDILSSNPWFWRLIAAFSLLVIEGVQITLFLKADLDPRLFIHYENAALSNFSLLAGVFSFSLLSLPFLFLLRDQPINLKSIVKDENIKALIPFSILSLIWILILIMGVGYQNRHHSRGYFSPASVPLIGFQVVTLLAIFFVSHKGSQWLFQRYPKLSSWFRLDIINLVLIWGVTFLLWSSVPVDPNYFLDAPQPPNQEFYLLSDSLEYEIEAMSLLAGKGFSKFVVHPIYVLFYGLLHFLAGDNYLDVVIWQVAMLSAIPVMLYLITKTMRNHLTGFFVAALVIIRERNQLLLMENISGSNVKMIMTEMPAVLCLLVFLYILIRWLRHPERRIAYPFLAGGILGISMLIRLELIAMIPVYVIAVTYLTQSDRRQWVRRVLLFMIGVLLVISPWIYRNWQKTGVVYIDKYYVIKSRFRDLPEKIPFYREGSVRDREYVFRDVNPIPIGGASKNQAVVPVREHPVGFDHGALGDAGDQRKGYLDHFANDFMQMFFIFPSSHQPLLSVGDLFDTDPSGGVYLSPNGIFSEEYVWQYVRRLPYYWTKWQGELAFRSVFPVLLSMIFISLGIHKMWSKGSSPTALLILTLALYMVGYSFYGSSGGRFFQVVDWIPMIFYGAGLMVVIPSFSDSDQGERKRHKEKEAKGPTPARGRRNLIIVGLLIFSVGLALPLFESAFPDQYTERELSLQLQDALADIQASHPSGGDKIREEILSSNVLAYGKVIYPRFYPAGERMEDNRLGKIPDYSYSRIEFYMVGTEGTWVTIPREKPIYIPHGSEVIVAGSWEEGKIVNNVIIFSRYLKSTHVLALQATGATGEWVLISAGEDG